jgi:hypothetical protein
MPLLVATWGLWLTSELFLEIFLGGEKSTTVFPFFHVAEKEVHAWIVYLLNTQAKFFANSATFKVSKWFVVDVLGFQIKLCCRYFLPFFDLATFWAIFWKFWQFFSNLLVTLNSRFCFALLAICHHWNLTKSHCTIIFIHGQKLLMNYYSVTLSFKVKWG